VSEKRRVGTKRDGVNTAYLLPLGVGFRFKEKTRAREKRHGPVSKKTQSNKNPKTVLGVVPKWTEESGLPAGKTTRRVRRVQRGPKINKNFHTARPKNRPGGTNCTSRGGIVRQKGYPKTLPNQKTQSRRQ